MREVQSPHEIAKGMEGQTRSVLEATRKFATLAAAALIVADSAGTQLLRSGPGCRGGVTELRLFTTDTIQ
jgi:hypothetical protein